MAERYGIQEWDMARLSFAGFQKIMAVGEAEARQRAREEVAMKAKRARGEV